MKSTIATDAGSDSGARALPERKSPHTRDLAEQEVACVPANAHRLFCGRGFPRGYWGRNPIAGRQGRIAQPPPRVVATRSMPVIGAPFASTTKPGAWVTRNWFAGP